MLCFNRWMASGKRPPKKVSLFQPGFKSSDLLVLYWYIWMCAPMKFRMEPDCVMIFVSLWRLEMDCSNNLGPLNSVVGTSTEPYKTCHLWSFLAHFIQGLLYLPSICLWVKKSHLLWLKMIGFLHLFLGLQRGSIHRFSNPSQLNGFLGPQNDGPRRTWLRLRNMAIFGIYVRFLGCIPPGKDRWRSPLPLVLVYHGPKNKSPANKQSCFFRVLQTHHV